MLIYRIDYELDDFDGSASSGRKKVLSFRATKPEVAQLKRDCGITLIDFRAQRVDVPTDRYGLVNWLNKTFSSKAQAAEKASGK